MKAILVEVRDAGTFIPALAVRFKPSTELERYLLSAADAGPAS